MSPLTLRVPVSAGKCNVMMLSMFQDTGVMDLVNDAINQPVTVFLPSDDAMAALPQEQKDFLFHQHNRPQLLEYLKYHVLLGQKVGPGRSHLLKEEEPMLLV